MNNARIRRQHGMTLVEVMVSITVGLILLSGVISIFTPLLSSLVSSFKRALKIK